MSNERAKAKAAMLEADTDIPDKGLLAYIEHQIASAHEEQIAFAEAAAKDIESALTWRAEGARVAVFTEIYARTVLNHLKLGHNLRPIYENLIDRLVLLALAHHDVQAEIRAIAGLAKSLKGWL